MSTLHETIDSNDRKASSRFQTTHKIIAYVLAPRKDYKLSP